ncbi:MAG: nucleotidyltransferase family protein, partial [Eubacterium sp.]
MKKEEIFLIKICRAYLNKSDVAIPDNIDWSLLFGLAKHHNLLGICHCILNNTKQKEHIPADFLTAVADKFFDYVYIYECQTNCLNEVKGILTASQTRHILFKGAVLRNLYPVPESRAMGDIDVLIEQKNRDKVKALLIDNGFICTEQNGPVYNYRKNNVLLEVHTRIISEFGDRAFDDAFANARFDNCTGTLDDDYHLAYLIAHTAHHFKFYGAGIRHVLDLAVLQKERKIDLSKAFDILSKLGLDTFAKVILSVCCEWFGIGEKYIDDTLKTQKYLCKCGAFGSMQENTGAIVARREMEAGNSSSFKIKLRLAFPPYEKLKNINYIKFIEGRPWLTPYAWCYRFFYNLKNRKAFMAKTISQIDDEKTHEL